MSHFHFMKVYDISSEWLTVLDAPSGEHTTMSAVISEISL